MPQKVPFHYPLILAGITLIIVSLMVVAAGSTLGDDADLTPTVNLASFEQEDATDVPPASEPTSAPTVEPTAEITADTTVEAENTPVEDVEPTEVATDIPADETDDPAATTDTATQYDPALVEQGEMAYNTACLACHGVGARGIEGLGKDLVDSEFVAGLTDEELHDFIIVGRPIWDAENTTGVDMPPKGGNPALTDDDIIAIIAYLRTEEAKLAGTTEHEVDSSNQDSSANPEDSTSTDESASPTGGAEFDPALAEEGEMVFVASCSACHGMDAKGIEGLGKPLVDSEFMQTHTVDELLTFVKTGRPIWDAENTTGVDMPPKGGNPALTDEQIIAVIHYIRSIDQ